MNTVENSLQVATEEMIKSMQKVDLESVQKAVDLILSVHKTDNVIYSVGNGGSASTAAHFVADLAKYATGDNGGFRTLDLVSNYSAHTAWTNDTDWENAWYGMLDPWIKKDDILVLFSVHGGSGWSGNLVKAIELAKSRGAKTIGFAGAGGGTFAKLCDVALVVPTPEKEYITPVTESIHVCLHHVICAEIRKRLSK
ncbi:SIS domain-containing protein [Aureispira anguillae]|uniref:SIS domain-containing protein n=1 Tax=Aureispira anguillae TaxID=2864201 RepID=A0A916DTL9_9BACT|nr:SIS domain-containing protein [Aureispira anguillae]BDS11591.1 SIS domain-containing protein [Aureispira anguillae]